MRDVLHGPRVALPGLPARARRVAAMDGVLDARPLERAVDRDRARAQRKQLARESEGLAHRGGRIEGAVVAGAVALDATGHHEARELFVRGELQKRVVLVVPENDVVARPVAPHQVGLEHQGLELVVGHDVLEVADLAHERVGLGITRARLLEVGPDAAPEGRGLADVQDLLLAVAVEVDSRPVRHPGDLLVEVHSD